MAAPLDDKIVSVSLDARKFASGVDTTVNSINKLNKSLKFPDAGKGLENIDKAAKKIDLSHIAAGVDTINHKLGALNVAALAIFTNIALKAVSTGAQVAKSFTIGPIIQGFNLYEQKLGSVQTILANTQAAGTTLKDVNKTLAILNDYSNKTIYNFGQMAKNIGTFTAAGVDLKTSTESIKGIANLAALSGSNADQASTAMYQLSQAIAAGQVHLQDWNSVVNAGMGGTVFQRALATTAQAMGKLKDGSVKLVGPMKNVSIAGESFRQSLQTGPGKASWLTSDVLTRTLANFTGDMTDAQLAAEGFTQEQIKAIQATAKTAFNAATQVKSLTQLLQVTKETVATGWATTWQIVLGDFGEAKKTFTALSNAINNFANKNAAARNKVLQDWKDLGGRKVLIDSLKTAFQNVSEILKPVQRAFRDIFPRTTGRQLYNLTLQFQKFVNVLKPSPTTMLNLRRTFRGLFAVLDIGYQIFRGFVTAFRELFHTVGGGSGGILKLTANLGDFLVSIDKALKKGNALHNFFVRLGQILALPIKFIERLKKALSDLFSGFSPGVISAQTNLMSKALTPLQKVLAGLTYAWEKFKLAFKNAASFFGPTIDSIIQAFQNLGPAIADAIKHMNVEAILQVIRTGLLAGFFVLFKNFLGKGGLLRFVQKNQVTVFSVIFRNVGDAIDGLTGSLQAMQTELKARALKEIAIAIALLAASVVALSFVNPKQLNSSLTALALLFAGLLGSMKVLDKIMANKSIVKLPFITAALIGFAFAIDLLTISVLALSRLNWDQLVKGLSGVVTLLGTLAVISGPLSKNSAGMIRAGAGVTVLAVGLNILALAVKQFGNMDLEALGKGLGSVAVGLVVIAESMKLMPKGSFIKGTALLPIALALNILAEAVKKFGALDLKTMGKGLLGIAGGLVVIAIAMRLMPANLPLTAAGLFLVSLALEGIEKAIFRMGRTPVKVLAQGLKALAISLLILAVALGAMSESLAGAAALAIAAAGLALLVPALIALGKQSWVDIIKGLVALAGAMVILGVASALIAPAAPALLAFGAALLLIGAGLALAGAGVFLVGAGLAAIAVAGPTAVAILVKALEDFTAAIPELVKNLVLGLLSIVETFAKTAPAFVAALVKILTQLLNVVIKLAPKIGKAFEVILTVALKVIRDKAPDLIETGIFLIEALLKGLGAHIKEVVGAAVDLILNFLKGLASKIVDVVAAGVDIVIAIIKGIAKGYLKIITTAAKVLLKFLDGLAKAIRKYEPQILAEGFKIGVALVQGIIDGMGSLAKNILKKAKDVFHPVIGFVKHNIFGQHSPSKVFFVIGQNVITGFVNGMSDKQEDPVKVATQMAQNVTEAMKHGFGITGTSHAKITEQVGKQVLQGFAAGLHGSTADIRNAFKTLDQNIGDAIRHAQQNIRIQQANLHQLLNPKPDPNAVKRARAQVEKDQEAIRKINKKAKPDPEALKTARKNLAEDTKALNEALSPKPDAKAVRDAQRIIAQNQAILASATAGHTEFIKALGAEKQELLKLSTEYEQVSKRLANAEQALADAKQKRSDAFKSFRDQYDQLPDIVSTDAQGHAIDSLQTYEDSLKAQAKAVAAYHTTLDQLRKLGLDDQTYQKLLSEGTGDQAFADQLLAGGKKAVGHLNQLDKNLNKNATSLATSASKALYDAGVKAAQGLVDGLKAKKSELHQAMQIIADSLVTAMKQALKSKSPSQRFVEIGQDASEGLAKGLLDASKAVTDAAYMVSDDAMGAMKDNLSQISDLVAENIDPNPTITPVLDLSGIQSDAKKLKGIFNKIPLAAKVSIGGAAVISAAQIPHGQVVEGQQPASISFVQNNHSPEALSAVDIYRQTRSQLSTLRSLVYPSQANQLKPGPQI